VRPAHIIDLCAELPNRPAQMIVRAVPALDLVALPAAAAHRAVQAIEQCRHAGPVLVCCALGYGRSAAAAAAWLCATGRAESREAASELVRQARPRAVVSAHDVPKVAPTAALGARTTPP
jgi:protein-tyrosine phosphatase